MLEKFIVENYKNFEEPLIVDFTKVGGYHFNPECITEAGTIGKMIIYGKNATGKTNLGRAIEDIVELIKVIVINAGVEECIINANSSESVAKFTYIFRFDDSRIQFEYQRNKNGQLVSEKFELDGREVYYIDYSNSKNIRVENINLIYSENINLENYLNSLNETLNTRANTLPFARWLDANIAFESGSVFRKFINYISGMQRVGTPVGKVDWVTSFSYRLFVEELDNSGMLSSFEEFLNAMGVGCRLEIRTLPDERKELYFVYNKLVPFLENASSGTLSLVGLYRNLFMNSNQVPSLLYLDEFDAFYHYEMSENLVKYLKKHYVNTQIIITSHNTNLMANRLFRPDCLFILSSFGKLTAICDATARELREGHNLEKMFISGEFEDYE